MCKDISSSKDVYNEAMDTVCVSFMYTSILSAMLVNRANSTREHWPAQPAAPLFFVFNWVCIIKNSLAD